MFLLENVAGLMNSHRSILDDVVEKLSGVGYRVAYHIVNAKDCGLPQNRPRLFIVGVLDMYVGDNILEWPSPLPAVDLEPFLDPMTESLDIEAQRPPLTQRVARANLSAAYDAIRRAGMKVSESQMVIDIDSTKYNMMHNCSPCLTRARAAGGGFWLSSRGRRMSTGEMERLMGIGVSAPVGWHRADLQRPDGISTRRWQALIGNGIPINTLQRVLASLLSFAGHLVQDKWAGESK